MYKDVHILGPLNFNLTSEAEDRPEGFAVSFHLSSRWSHILIGLLRMGGWISLGAQVVIPKFRNTMNEDPKHQEGDSMRQKTLLLVQVSSYDQAYFALQSRTSANLGQVVLLVE